MTIDTLFSALMVVLLVLSFFMIVLNDRETPTEREQPSIRKHRR